MLESGKRKIGIIGERKSPEFGKREDGITGVKKNIYLGINYRPILNIPLSLSMNFFIGLGRGFTFIIITGRT